MAAWLGSRSKPPAPVEEPAPPEQRVAPPPPTPERFVIGASLQIKGDLTVHEDLVVDTVLEGTIRATGHRVTVAAGARIRADIHAREVIVMGTVEGGIFADERIEIAPTGSVEGDVQAPQVVVADGSTFSGSINKTSPVERLERSDAAFDAA